MTRQRRRQNRPKKCGLMTYSHNKTKNEADKEHHLKISISYSECIPITKTFWQRHAGPRASDIPRSKSGGTGGMLSRGHRRPRMHRCVRLDAHTQTCNTHITEFQTTYPLQRSRGAHRPGVPRHTPPARPTERHGGRCCE